MIRQAYRWWAVRGCPAALWARVSPRQRETAMMGVYYVTTAGVGILTAIGDPSPQLASQLGAGWPLWSFGSGYTVAAALGLWARVQRHPMAEARAVALLALFTLAHGAVLLTDGAWVSGVRLVAAPLMMLAFASMLKGITFSRGEVAAVTPRGPRPTRQDPDGSAR